jgi:hypothetical protein
MKPAPLIAVILFSLVAIAHALRLVLQIEVTAGGAVVPMWVSVLGVLVPGGVALMLWREQSG